MHIDTDREEAGLVGVTARAAAQTTLEATMGNINTPSVWVDPSNGVSYYVVTQYDAKRLSTIRSARDRPGAGRRRDGAAITLGSYSKIRRSTVRSPIERNQLARAAHVLMQVEGRDLGSTAADLEEALEEDPRTAGIKVDFVGQVDLMRTTFSGLGLAIGLAVMVVFMIMASQFKSLRLPFDHAVHDPVHADRHRARAARRRARVLDDRADGRADGRRHRGLQRHPARRPRAHPARRRAVEARRDHRCGAHAVRADRDDDASRP